MQNNLLKRLDIIQNAVAMEEEELIEMQLKIIQQLKLDESAQHIVDLIKMHHFERVIQLIEQYKHDNSGLTIYEDPKIKGLKLQLKLLEDQLNTLTDEKTEYERLINNFNSEYTLRLGDLIDEILKLRLSTANSSDRQDAEETYESFKQQYHQQLLVLTQQLTEEEKKELKTIFRKASRLCHPDKLTDVFKAQGEAAFKDLNDAYRRQDLARAKEILFSIETGGELKTASDSIDDKDLLRQKISLIQNNIEALKIEINGLQESETYQQLQSIDDTDAYFVELKKALQEEYALLNIKNTQ